MYIAHMQILIHTPFNKCVIDPQCWTVLEDRKEASEGSVCIRSSPRRNKETFPTSHANVVLILSGVNNLFINWRKGVKSKINRE